MRDLFRRWHVARNAGGPSRIGRIGIHLVERDFVFVDVGIVQRLVIVQMPGDLNRGAAGLSRKQMFVPEILFVLLERARS